METDEILADGGVENKLVTKRLSPVISFHLDSGEPVGMLFMDSDGVLQFKGDMSESARLFFENQLKGMCDDYIASKFETPHTAPLQGSGGPLEA